MRIRTTLTLGLIALGLVASACTIQPTSQTRNSPAIGDAFGTQSLPAANEPVEAVTRLALPAVVNVTSDVVTSAGQAGQGVGTGFIVRSDGVIVTNCHVVEGATKITVFTSTDKPDQYDARVIGGDCEHDLAVLKIEGKNLPTLQLGNSKDLQLGQSVVAIGYALALEGGPTVTTGIVSSLDRVVQVQDPNCDVCQNQARTYSNVIQTDAAINHGNSGGPLLNLQGQVVGINSAGADSAQNIGFAIAIDAAKDAIRQAMTDPLGASPYLGVTTKSVTPDAAFQLGLTVDSGAYVLATTADGPARGAGVLEGDVIVSIGGTPVAGADDVGTILAGLSVGQSVDVGVVRTDGTSATLHVTLGTRPLPDVLP